VIVLELPGRGGRGVGRLLAELRVPAADRGVSVITVVESHIPYGRRHGSGPAVRMAELIDPTTIGSGELSSAHHGRLLAMAGHRAAVVQDVLDATTMWPAEVVFGVIDDSYLCRELLDRLSAALLRRCEPAQLEALDVCLATGYWHPELGTYRVPAAELRPWVVPLEHEWGWLRPIWARSLRSHLDGRSPCRLHKRGSEPVPRPAAPVRTSAPSIEARLLGTFELRVDGVQIGTWHGRRGISVLRYLLMRERLNCPRDELLAEFWPEVPPELARNRLQVAVSGLRKALLPATDGHVIEFADGCYRLSHAFRFDVDVKQFEAALHQAQEIDRSGDADGALRAYRRAVTGYRGDFAADAPYEQWTLLPRENLRIGYIGALDRLARLQFETSDVDECIATGHRMLEVDPCREDAHRLLMRCYARQGRVYQALRQYEFCCRILSATIETRPAPQTTRLYRTIRAGPRRSPP
jgi:DNA-binding SARP family transcriptional activator